VEGICLKWKVVIKAADTDMYEGLPIEAEFLSKLCI
jgi:hypothetical protein